MGRFDIWFADLDPTRGAEIAKTRPCVIVSPDELNARLLTVTLVPITSTRRGWPIRVPIDEKLVSGEAALDHIRSIDKSRLIRKAGALSPASAQRLTRALLDMFAA